MNVLPARFEVVEAGRLTFHPENANVGNVGLIGESIGANGFYGAVMVQESTGRVIAGEHRLRAALADGATHVPVLWQDVDDATALAILVNDNATARAARWRLQRLNQLLKDLGATPAGLGGVGLQPFEVEAILAAQWEPAPALAEPPGEPTPRPVERSLRFGPGDKVVVERALATARTAGGDASLPDGDALAVICRDYLSAYGR